MRTRVGLMFLYESMPQFDIVSFFDNGLLFFIIPVFFLSFFFIIFFPDWISFCKVHKKFITLLNCSVWLISCRYSSVLIKSNYIFEGWLSFFIYF